MDEHLVQSALNYHRFLNPGKISITPTMRMVNQPNPALAYCWECGLETVRMHSDRDNETDEEATSPESLLIEEEKSIWANIPALGATSRVGT
jgi:malate dehydrogenase (oxaloacetate-decarboxylating)(NADP+)